MNFNLVTLLDGFRMLVIYTDSGSELMVTNIEL